MTATCFVVRRCAAHVMKNFLFYEFLRSGGKKGILSTLPLFEQTSSLSVVSSRDYHTMKSIGLLKMGCFGLFCCATGAFGQMSFNFEYGSTLTDLQSSDPRALR